MKNKITSKKFNTYQEMSQSATNWEHQCSYTLLPHAFDGEHHVIKLPNIQLSYSNREGGFMHDAVSPKDSISIAIIQECHSQACFDKFKLYKGMVLFFDDSKAFNYMSKGKIITTIISIPKHVAKEFKIKLTHLLGSYIEDKEGLLAPTLYHILKEFLSLNIKLDINKAQKELITLVEHLVDTQSIKDAKLTKGEKIALSIRDQVYHHMDGKINIETFANQYQVTEQTLQNAFKSLFGFTPKYFLQLLKLNLVHHDLQESTQKETTVLRVASKWGFSHMGRFSQEYTKLFGQNPSQTLKSLEYSKDNMVQSCTSRKEEME